MKFYIFELAVSCQITVLCTVKLAVSCQTTLLCTVKLAVSCQTVMVCHFFRYHRPKPVAFTVAVSDELCILIQEMMFYSVIVFRNVTACDLLGISVLEECAATIIINMCRCLCF